MQILGGQPHERQLLSQPVCGDQLMTITRLLYIELVNTGRLIATTTSGINLWLADNRAGSQSLEAFIPANPSVFPLLLKESINLGLSCEALQSLQTFYARLDFAKRILRSIMSSGHIKPNQLVSEVEHAASAWRLLCGMNISMIYESQAMFLCQSDAPAFPRDPEVLMMLSAACDGGYPNLVDGSLAAPDWAERRRYSRLQLDFWATLDVGHESLRVRAVDISTVGLCVEPATNLSTGERLTVILDNGRRLPGTVKWAKETRAGIEFEIELNVDDPLVLLQSKSQRPSSADSDLDTRN